MPDQRLLTRPQLREFLGNIPWSEIEYRMAHGFIPRPVWGLKPDDRRARWDKNAVDIALDQASSIPSSLQSEIAALDRAIANRKR